MARPDRRSSTLSRPNRPVPGILSALAIAFALFWTVTPLLLAAVLSIKPRSEFFTGSVLPFFQFAPTLDHWRTEFAFFWFGPGMGQTLLNSTLIGGVSALLAVAVGGLAAQQLASRPPRHFWPVFLLLLLPRLIPPVIVALPFTRIMEGLGLHDSQLALILGHTTLLLPWAFLILCGAVRAIPAELRAAATLDGCGELQLLRWIILPLSSASVLAAFTLCFALSWNEYPFAILNSGVHVTTVTGSVASLFTKDGVEFEYVGSHLLLTMAPPMVMALLARGAMTRALSLGALEEPATVDSSSERKSRTP